eukprot:scaffold434_cov186-Pinguiococcus_pyrenoidosus.AAC.113
MHVSLIDTVACGSSHGSAKALHGRGTPDTSHWDSVPFGPVASIDECVAIAKGLGVAIAERLGVAGAHAF